MQSGEKAANFIAETESGCYLFFGDVAQSHAYENLRFSLLSRTICNEQVVPKTCTRSAFLTLGYVRRDRHRRASELIR